MKPARLGLVVALAVLLADQASKWWILHGIDLPARGNIPLLPVLSLSMVWNRGVTFGLMQAFGDWGHVGLALLSLAVVVGLLVWLLRVQTVWTAVAIGAIAGGAVGNIVDRLRFGAVVDFIHVVLNSPWGELFPWVFNVGDSAIVCGVGALLLEQYVWPAKPRND